MDSILAASRTPFRWLCAFAAILLLGACGVQRGTTRDTATLPPGYGVAVARILMVNGEKLPSIPQISAISRSSVMVADVVVEMNSHTNYSVTILREGDYSWRGVYVGTRSSEFRGLLPFHITAGEVNYVGDLTVTVTPSRYGLSISDHSSDLRAYMTTNYPHIMKGHPFVTSLTQDHR